MNKTEAADNPIPPSEYIAAQYYLPLSIFPLLCCTVLLSRYKPLSERYPALQLFGAGGGMFVCFMQSLQLSCGWHRVWNELLIPVCLLPILFQAYRFDIKCRFREAMAMEKMDERLRTLLKLKKAASYSYIGGMFLVCLTPHAAIVWMNAIFSDAFKSSETGYRAYGDAGFCKTETLLYDAMAAMLAASYVGMMFKIASKVRHNTQDEFGIFSNIKRVAGVGALCTLVYGIVFLVDMAYIFYAFRVGVIVFVGGMLIPQLLEVWSYAKTHSTIDVNDKNIRLKEIFSNLVGINAFRKQLAAEFAAENLDFWNEVRALEQDATTMTAADIDTRSKHVYDLYIPETAALQVNISSRLLNRLKAEAKAGRYSADMFHDAQAEIFALMEKDSLPRFKRSAFFKECTEALHAESDHSLAGKFLRHQQKKRKQQQQQQKQQQEHNIRMTGQIRSYRLLSNRSSISSAAASSSRLKVDPYNNSSSHAAGSINGSISCGGGRNGGAGLRTVQVIPCPAGGPPGGGEDLV